MNIFGIIVLAICITNTSSVKQHRDFFNIKTERIHENAIVLKGTQFQTNQLIVNSDQGLILVDSGISPEYAFEIRKIAQKEFGTSRFAYVINTHHHWDHAQGNQIFTEATIIAHENCYSSMLRQNTDSSQTASVQPRYAREGKAGKGAIPPPPPSHILVHGSGNFRLTPPHQTVSNYRLIQCGQITIQLFAFENFHTNNDLMVLFEDLGILACGDLFFNKSLPIIKPWKICRMDHHLETLDKILTENQDIKFIVPGHNQLMHKNELCLYNNYLKKIWLGIKNDSSKNLSLADVKKKYQLIGLFPELTRFDVRSNGGKSLHEGNVSVIWDHFQHATVQNRRDQPTSQKEKAKHQL